VICRKFCGSTVSRSSRTNSPWGGLQAAAPSIIPAIVAALLPKCPLCLGTYGAILSTLGVGSLVQSTSTKLMLLAIITGFRFWALVRAPRPARYASLVLSLTAIGLLAASLLAYRSTLIATSGMVLLVMSVVLELKATSDTDAPGPKLRGECGCRQRYVP